MNSISILVLVWHFRVKMKKVLIAIEHKTRGKAKYYNVNSFNFQELMIMRILFCFRPAWLRILYERKKNLGDLLIYHRGWNRGQRSVLAFKIWSWKKNCLQFCAFADYSGFWHYVITVWKGCDIKCWHYVITVWKGCDTGCKPRLINASAKPLHSQQHGNNEWNNRRISL